MKFLLALALIAIVALGSARAAGKPAAPVAPPTPPPKSTFVIDPKFGRDPFFPRSERLTRLLPKITNEVTEVTPPPPPQFPDESIRCNGISSGAGRRIALVNNKSMEKGESVEFRLPTGQTVKATCVEVREKSVVIEVNGVVRELHLRSVLK